MNQKILVGSSYFFKKFEDFVPKDKDFVLIVDHPLGFKNVRQTSGSFCLFEWRRMKPEEFIEYALRKGPAMQLGKFLVPEFANEIGFTIEHLKKLQRLVNRLDERHQYEKVIYESYIKNNSFTLTEEQLEQAYEAYKEARKEKKDVSIIQE